MPPRPEQRDALLICSAGFLRSATVSLVGVTLAIHLAEIGFSPTRTGLLIGVGLAGSSLATVLVSLRGDAWGRRRVLIVLAIVPTRQSYVMAVVKPGERTFASGVTNVTRNVAWAVGPSVAGVVMQHVALGGPLFVGGALKIAYDLLLYRSFRNVRPPEEEVAARV